MWHRSNCRRLKANKLLLFSHDLPTSIVTHETVVCSPSIVDAPILFHKHRKASLLTHRLIRVGDILLRDTMTSLGALTTTFEAPAACASSTGIHIVGCGSGCVWWAEGPLDVSECYPSSYNPSLDNYYSPGLCPSGYTPACTSRTSLATLTETIYTCCPTALGYTYRCIGTPDWPWQSSLGCTVYFSDPTSTFTFPDATFITDDETMQTSTARTEVGIGAYGIEVRFQRADFASTTSTVSIRKISSSISKGACR